MGDLKSGEAETYNTSSSWQTAACECAQRTHLASDFQQEAIVTCTVLWVMDKVLSTSSWQLLKNLKNKKQYRAHYQELPIHGLLLCSPNDEVLNNHRS